MARDLRHNIVRAPKGSVIPNKNVELRSDVVVKAKDLSTSIEDIQERIRLLEFPQAVAIEADSPWVGSEFTTDLQTILDMIVANPSYGFLFEGSDLSSIAATTSFGPPLVDPPYDSGFGKAGYWEVSGSFSYAGIDVDGIVGVSFGFISSDGLALGPTVVIPKLEDTIVTGYFQFIRNYNVGDTIDITFETADFGMGGDTIETSDVKGSARYVGSLML